MSEVKINEVLEYFKEVRTRSELMEHFNLTNSESYHLVRWMKKANLIQVIEKKGQDGAMREFLKAKPGAHL